MRHAVLLLFVAIALYPVLNVLSISLRPGNRLRSTDLAIIPHDWTLESYQQLFTEQPFLQWLGNSLIVATARHGHRRRAGGDRRLCLQPVSVRRPQCDDARDPDDANVPGHDAAAAAVYP